MLRHACLHSFDNSLASSARPCGPTCELVSSYRALREARGATIPPLCLIPVRPCSYGRVAAGRARGDQPAFLLYAAIVRALG